MLHSFLYNDIIHSPPVFVIWNAKSLAPISPRKERAATGLRLPLETMLGRLTLPANRMAQLFDEEKKAGSSQFDLILFLDGKEKQNAAVEADEAGFRQSWTRPKWHITIQGP